MGRLVSPERVGRGLALAALLSAGGCTAPRDAARPARMLDTTTVGRIAGYLDRGLGRLSRDSTRGILDLLAAVHLNPRAHEFGYLLAWGHLVAKDTLGLVRWLDSLATWRSCLTPSPETFAPMAGNRAVADAMTRVRDAAPNEHRSTVAFSLPSRDLFPEGIAYDSVEPAFFLSSLRHRTVVRVTRDASGRVDAREFVPPGSDSLYSVLGMKVDAGRRRLWVVTAGEGFAVNERPEEVGRSAILVYDLTTGRRLRRWPVSPPPNRLTNDISLDPAGDAYITDTPAAMIYRARFDADSVETFIPAGKLRAPNGIVVTPDGRKALVADAMSGVWVVDLATRALSRLPQPPGIMPLFLDGLDLHRGALIGVTHALSGGWVLRFSMSAGYDSIRTSEVLDCNHPAMRQPTTGVVVGDTLFYVATSQFRSFAKGQPWPNDRLADITVLRLGLPTAAP